MNFWDVQMDLLSYESLKSFSRDQSHLNLFSEIQHISNTLTKLVRTFSGSRHPPGLDPEACFPEFSTPCSTCSATRRTRRVEQQAVSDRTEEFQLRQLRRRRHRRAGWRRRMSNELCCIIVALSLL